MKKNLFPLLALLILIFPACQEQIDVEKEKEAIITVLNDETQAWIDRDYERLASHWVQDESTRRLSASNTGYGSATWEEMSSNLKENIENDSLWLGVEDMKAEKTDMNIKVSADCAWATFIENESWNYQGEPYQTEAIQLVVLEKNEGQWQIAAFVGIGKSSYEAAAAEEEEETEEPAEEESEE